MKKIICVLVVLGMLCTSAFASALQDALDAIEHYKSGESDTESEYDWYVENVFMYYAPLISEISYREVGEYLDLLNIDYETQISENDFAEYYIDIDAKGNIYIFCYPLDYSLDSTEFGDPDKEMLSTIELTIDSKSISISDSMHTQGIAFETLDKTRTSPTQNVDSFADLIRYYNNEMGGNANMKFDSDNKIDSENDISSEIGNSARERIDEYWYVEYSDISIARDQSSTSAQMYNVFLYLNYTDEYSNKQTISELETFSGDMAVTLYGIHDKIANLYVLWEMPNDEVDGIVAKFKYEKRDDGVYCVDETGSVFTR